jgi:hypothetical protein
MAVWYILRPIGKFYGHFGTFCGPFGIFFPFWFIVPRKIWQPCLKAVTVAGQTNSAQLSGFD